MRNENVNVSFQHFQFMSHILHTTAYYYVNKFSISKIINYNIFTIYFVITQYINQSKLISKNTIIRNSYWFLNSVIKSLNNASIFLN